jgi:hypothetical protein
MDMWYMSVLQHVTRLQARYKLRWRCKNTNMHGLRYTSTTQLTKFTHAPVVEAAESVALCQVSLDLLRVLQRSTPKPHRLGKQHNLSPHSLDLLRVLQRSTYEQARTVLHHATYDVLQHRQIAWDMQQYPLRVLQRSTHHISQQDTSSPRNL